MTISRSAPSVVFDTVSRAKTLIRIHDTLDIFFFFFFICNSHTHDDVYLSMCTDKTTRYTGLPPNRYGKPCPQAFFKTNESKWNVFATIPNERNEFIRLLFLFRPHTRLRLCFGDKIRLTVVAQYFIRHVFDVPSRLVKEKKSFIISIDIKEITEIVLFFTDTQVLRHLNFNSL